MDIERRAMHIDGVVQGVGFRPFIYGLAMRHAVSGWVLNSSSGVDIEVQGAVHAVNAFEAAITAEAPPLARIHKITSASMHAIAHEQGFNIQHSHNNSGISLVPPDVATCPDCLRELFDPANRRYRYPFTNCTNCGPRYTIIAAMPYDRPMTTMHDFMLCPECRAEYDNPLDRRYHAQPNACPICGPRLTLIGSSMPGFTDEIAEAAALIRAGYILAVRGVGGFHLACDATNNDAVTQLRSRKSRPDKPFAVMMENLNDVRARCAISETEADILSGPSAPIVLLHALPSDIAPSVAPHLDVLGVMLPYTPLHHLLLHDAGVPLVMTSGNLSDMPIINDNDEALRSLDGVADAFLLHNRPIALRCDDAVWWVSGEQPQPLRRSRGDAPYPIALGFHSNRHILGVGAEMKNTLCLLRDNQAFLSQHIGEIESLESLDYFTNTLDHLSTIFKIEPALIVHDAHPGYLTTRFANQLAEQRGITGVAVQHHHAHIAACLAENRCSDPVIGIALDGTGYGSDGAIWGGEVLIADMHDYQRAYHLGYMPLPGGDASVRRPYRIAWSYLQSALGHIPDLHGLTAAPVAERAIVLRQIEQHINTPMTSSAGRLFDAVAAILGLCTVSTYEGQAAIALESCASAASCHTMPHAYTYSFNHNAINLVEMLDGIVKDITAGRSTSEIAMQFHLTITRMMVDAARRVSADTNLNIVALSGGVFQNRLLLRLIVDALCASGFQVLTHHQVPANDGGLSLGQAAIGAAKIKSLVP